MWQCAAGNSKANLFAFDKATDVLDTKEHSFSLCVYAYTRKELVFFNVCCVKVVIFEIFFIEFFSQSLL